MTISWRWRYDQASRQFLALPVVLEASTHPVPRALEQHNLPGTRTRYASAVCETKSCEIGGSTVSAIIMLHPALIRRAKPLRRRVRRTKKLKRTYSIVCDQSRQVMTSIELALAIL